MKAGEIMNSTTCLSGRNTAAGELVIKKKTDSDRVIAIAGNPNVGKSTLFNALTGMHQHTGNWPGKTVANAQGYCKTAKNSYVLVDIPGTYSLLAHSPEEEVARNFICFGKPQGVVLVCDGTCLERNLNLVLQTLEITENVIVCVNLLDEARRKGIEIDLDKLSRKLGVQVVGTVARDKKSLKKLTDALDNGFKRKPKNTFRVRYPEIIENAISMLEPKLESVIGKQLNNRWLSLKLLEQDTAPLKEIEQFLGFDILRKPEIEAALKEAKEYLYAQGVRGERLKDMIASATVLAAERLCAGVVVHKNKGYNLTDRKIDKVLTGKRYGYPVMLLLLAFIFWLTISGANYISAFLSGAFAIVESKLSIWLVNLNAPPLLQNIIIEGLFRVPSWVVSVMLPPMAIFFPLFTLLEDAGYLPRVAFNLDKPFKRCQSCGKQALTMCMGFGCNAAGVVGCRIIDSPRERLLAILTNAFVPCNGRFPAIIAIISMFFVTATGVGGTVLSAFALTLVIILGIFTTFAATRLLSATLLKGETSSYTLEMPPYRKPQLGRVIVRSVFDRTLFVLGRAVSVAIPAGIIIWLMANITFSGSTLLSHCAEFLDPLGHLMGLDGVILMAFILGFPANEIVIPLIIMAYLSNGSLAELTSLTQMREILVSNGWTPLTALCTIIFSLMHWPCSTTVLTIKKETGSVKWTLLSVIIPTAAGALLCMIITFVYRLFI